MNDTNTYTPAAVYARVSSDRQDVDLSIAAQLRALREYAERNGFIIVREYVDEAESGRVADRPQFREMIEAGGSAQAPFNVILVWKFSRFTRKREHAVAFKSMLRKRGIRVVSITEHADDTPTGKLMEAIIESVDEFYSENLAQEVVRGMREAASRGYFLACRAPFGYRRVKVSDGVKERPTLEVDPNGRPDGAGDIREFAAGQRSEGDLPRVERQGHQQPGEAVVQEWSAPPADERGVHGDGGVGREEQGREGRRAGSGGGRMARAGLA